VLSIQKSFQIIQKTLYLVATPIGHLQELTPRALEILKNSELILCESVHSYQKLSSYFQIGKKSVISYNNLTEKNSYQTKKIIQKMLNYEKIVLVANAGYSLISDPGRILVSEWIALGNYVVPVSGSSAFLNSLVASGLYYHHFTFFGFLPRNNKKQQNLLLNYKSLPNALVIYESSHRLLNTLNNVKLVLGNRLIAIGRELTKLYEEFIRGSLEEMINYLQNNKLKGELTIIIGINQ